MQIMLGHIILLTRQQPAPLRMPVSACPVGINSQISNVISGGYVFVYCTCTNMRDAAANQLYQSTDGSMFVGIKKSGAFVNPNSATSISITPQQSRITVLFISG